MKLVNFYRKPISMLVMVTFTILLGFWANQTPAASTAPASEKSQGTALENSIDENINFVEKEEPAAAIKKGKKFPWLIVALVAVTAGAALYFLVLKKKNYTLTVTVGEGVTGTPVAGTSTHKKGTAVAYDYSLKSGYKNVQVTLDGIIQSGSSGQVTMNANHTLAVSSKKLVNYTLTVNQGEGVSGSMATGVYTYIEGTQVTYSYLLKTGYTNLVVLLDEAAVLPAGTITMDRNHSLSATAIKAIKYKLTVEMYGVGGGVWTSGTPAVGTYWYDGGTTINYSYHSDSAHGLRIIINGVIVYDNYDVNSSYSGSFVINKNTLIWVGGT
jgi:hypothetical protein